MASSPDVLRNAGDRHAKGLQQHYSPPEAARLVAAVLGTHNRNVLDLTAGDGSLITGWPKGRRYGIEIDSDQVESGDYYAIHGDLQRVYPLLRLSRLTFPAVALNPPFGLDWTDPSGKKVNSTLQALRFGLGVMEADGLGVLIAGQGRYDRQIAGAPEARGVYAVIECDDLFDGVVLPCVMAFFVQPHQLKDDAPAPARRKVTRAELTDLHTWVVDARQERCSPRVTTYTYLTPPDHAAAWATINAEHDKRRKALEAGQQASHDITIKANKLRVRLSPFAQLAMAKSGQLQQLRRLNGQSPSYFAYNAREWRAIEVAARDELVTVDPVVAARVESIIGDAKRLLVPNYPIRPQQRLGYLDDLDSIVCTRTDAERGYLAGERYDLAVRSKESVTNGERVHTNRDGEQSVRAFKQTRKLLEITIGPHSFDEEPDQIKYLLEHFELPDPGDLASLYPLEVDAMRDVLRAIAARFGLHGHEGPLAEGRIRWNFKDFQVEDLARMLVKRSGLLAWEQGLGKSLGLMALAIALDWLGVQPAALFVVPQDLIPQWQDEAKRFFGREFTIVEGPAHAHQVAQHVAGGGSGWFMVHMEGLSLTGRRDDSLNLPTWSRRKSDAHTTYVVHPREFYRLPAEMRAHAIKHTGVPLRPAREDGKLDLLGLLTTDEVCPNCLQTAGAADGEPILWDGKVCKSCSYVHKRLRVHTAGHELSIAFRRGAIMVDEITNASGDSLRADAVCALRSDHRFGGTGTPIKNYVNDAFKLLWWCLGNATERFPYDFTTGRGKFENDFCVIETLYGGGKDSKNAARKVLPRVTNLSMLWRLLCGGMIRRRKEDTGEPLVPCTIHPIWVPAGRAQAAMNKQWAKQFVAFFAHKNPYHPLVEAGVVERFEAALGLLWKMEYASTLPAADPDLDWLVANTADETTRELLEGVSNWTPANLKSLEIVLEHARAGEKVVVFSDLIETGRWFCGQLLDRGVRAAHIVEERDGKAATKNPRKRAAAMRGFRFGDTQVLCVGIKAVKQGHNLDTASVAVFVGQEWSHEAKAQAMARVHRLSSVKPVNIYVPMPKGQFMAARKHDLLNAKGASSDLALDGQLIEQDEREIGWQQVVEQMKRQGFALSGDEIDEREIKARWDRAEGPFAHLAPPPPVETMLDQVPTLLTAAPTRPNAGVLDQDRVDRLLAGTPDLPVIEADHGQLALAF
ncbi:helicase-related protein [Solirubrobacter pauli]|uniref:helicase-related protein n=1 Tax=Solirubrobacter pauli TaxID=166793 RepID=UPI001476FD99|nr:helicase-related protein [Solirubrobacter pauli]